MSPYRENARPRFTWLAPSARRDIIILVSVAAVFVSGVTVQCLRGEQAVEGTSEITTAEVASVIATNKVDLRERCFTPKRDIASANVNVEIRIDADGSVREATATGSHPGVSTCVENEVKQWRFPARSAPTTQPIRLPFVFERT